MANPAGRRSYAKQTVYDAHLSSARHQKLAQRLQEAGGSSAQDEGARQAAAEHARLEQAKRALRAKLLDRDEALVRALGQALVGVRDETRANVERKAALTEREREEEAEEIAREYEEAVATGGMGYGSRGDEEEEEERRGERDYNPLNLPLDFDGRPIPVWMYKLHGLGVEYKCEICSDFVYRGRCVAAGAPAPCSPSRKNFEKHFQESRHAFGMRALGLPNLVQFRDVTRIQDAFALAEKLKRQERLAEEDPGDAEEVEDEHGNVRASAAARRSPPGLYPENVRPAQAAGPRVVALCMITLRRRRAVALPAAAGCGLLGPVAAWTERARRKRRSLPAFCSLQGDR